MRAFVPLREPVPPAGRRAALREAREAALAGRWRGADGALDIALAVLAARPEDEEARLLRDEALEALDAAALDALLDDRLEPAREQRALRLALDPADPRIAMLDEALAAADDIARRLRRAERRVAAGALVAPAGRNAAAGYRAVLARQPAHRAAAAGLAAVEARLLDDALEAARQDDLRLADRRLAEAATVREGSPAVQDAAARVAAIREARAGELLAAGLEAAARADIAGAEATLEVLARITHRGEDVERLRDRIAVARLYGRFRPGEVFRDRLPGGVDGPAMVAVPHGRFRMGSARGEPGHQSEEAPAHAIAFERGFGLGQAEVTVGEYRRFIEATGHVGAAARARGSSTWDERGGSLAFQRAVDWRHDHAGAPADDAMPVLHVAWDDAAAYAAWLAEATGEAYRLPTEAEFEYALRAGGDTPWPWGDAPRPPPGTGNLTGDGDVSPTGRRWQNAFEGYADGHWGPAPAGDGAANAWGLRDLVGNVSEWVEDCWHDSYRRAPGDGSAWVNPGCRQRVVRGASWASGPEQARSAFRQPAAATTTNPRVGFRVARDL
jgi:formylglycine-generating enzyme required for sulfatase activity